MDEILDAKYLDAIIDIKAVIKKTQELKAEAIADKVDGECIANVTLAIRHLEDAFFRLREGREGRGMRF